MGKARMENQRKKNLNLKSIGMNARKYLWKLADVHLHS
jgi:hypothetical protein